MLHPAPPTPMNIVVDWNHFEENPSVNAAKIQENIDSGIQSINYKNRFRRAAFIVQRALHKSGLAYGATSEGEYSITIGRQEVPAVDQNVTYRILVSPDGRDVSIANVHPGHRSILTRLTRHLRNIYLDYESMKSRPPGTSRTRAITPAMQVRRAEKRRREHSEEPMKHMLDDKQRAVLRAAVRPADERAAHRDEPRRLPTLDFTKPRKAGAASHAEPAPRARSTGHRSRRS